MNDHDVLLTGVPRSGTTLACELLNRLPDTVALDEPMDVEALARLDPSVVCEEIDRALAGLRDSIVTQRRAPSWQVEGRVFAGRIADDAGGGSLRKSLGTRGDVRIEKELSPSFLLVAKHPAVFTALLEALVERFEVYATVRNPLAVLSSWQTVPLDVNDGSLPVAERIDLALAEALAAIEDTLDRQLHLLGWFFEKYRSVLPETRIIPYESIVRSRGTVLSVITPAAAGLDEPLKSRNAAEIYDRAMMRLLAERLLDADGPYWDLYTKESVTRLLDE